MAGRLRRRREGGEDQLVGAALGDEAVSCCSRVHGVRAWKAAEVRVRVLVTVPVMTNDSSRLRDRVGTRGVLLSEKTLPLPSAPLSLSGS
jgi:hypothetical protein